ncbi:MAG: FMN reductase [Phenylobacterium sp.]|uniref:NADPH-dependent FMN reductase n=1 Tax=Phenylobacterium sp. TaxID=1871053 RepID=UPI0025DF3FFC|nr:NADPH-dependent FMN reductase [Phenylobacterium sp.]MBI1197207.1 FMN reductase [Phenylobacterium sp.]
MRLLAISGSLRAASSNTRVIEALARLAPAGVAVEVYRGLGELPHFNPDLEDSLPATVADLRRRVGEADGLVICSPEYAHGVAGTMKNALDWLVPSLEFPQTPVALINASPRARHAIAHMRETLLTMSARIVDDACVEIDLGGRPLSAEEIAADGRIGPDLKAALAAFADAIAAFGPRTLD